MLSPKRPLSGSISARLFTPARFVSNKNHEQSDVTFMPHIMVATDGSSGANRAVEMGQRRRKSDGLIPNFLRNAVLKCDELLNPSRYATSVTDSGRGPGRIRRS
jgi:hypothetical protein